MGKPKVHDIFKPYAENMFTWAEQTHRILIEGERDKQFYDKENDNKEG